MLQWHASAAGCHAAGQLHKYRRTSRQQQRFSGEKHEVTAQETVKCMEGMTNKGGLPVQRNHCTTAISWPLKASFSGTTSHRSLAVAAPAHV